MNTYIIRKKEKTEKADAGVKVKKKGRVRTGIDKGISWLEKRPVISLICLALLLNLIIEMLSHRSVIEGALSLLTPFVFIYNSCIIFFTFSPWLFFKKKYFFVMLVMVAWLSLAAANCIVLGFRTTPVAAIDLTLAGSMLSLLHIYLKGYQIYVAVAIWICAGVGLIWLFIVIPKTKVLFKKSIIVLAISVAVVVGLTFGGRQLGMLESTFGNLHDAYEDYGFIYCFSWSVIDRGVSKPDVYSDAEIDGITGDLSENDAAFVNTTFTPNVIFLQMESFFDVRHITSYTYSENPMPVFQAMKAAFSSGYLSVPSIGAGTVNTEFEVITGMSLEHFGTGEYPYKTILREKACESICYDLMELGYSTHAIHNNTGTFYSRNVVYPNLGFETFTPLEYMTNVVYNPLGWAKDIILKDEILKTLNSTENQDLIYTVSVQGHGKYPDTLIDDTQTITVSGVDESIKTEFEYYVNQLHEMDEFLGELTAALREFDEPVVLVVYGDHLPGFDISADMLDGGNEYQTDYVIWSNFDMDITDEDLYAYQLSARVFEYLDMEGGIISQLHQESSDDNDYQEKLELLEYDMLYGNMEVYDGEYPYEAADMKMGAVNILIRDVNTSEGDTYIVGENFTEWSHVYINGKKMNTEYLGPYILKVSDCVTAAGDEMYISQMTPTFKTLGKTEPIILD